MSSFRYGLVNTVGTLLRLLPWPSPTGLRPIGQPDRSSPVLVTCNYRLTVERVVRALDGLDCYLLVANSRGVNVWCASTGGLFTHHDVVSVLKTSGIGERVDHRRVILPQLAATGVQAGQVRARAGWEVIWGPLSAADLPVYLSGDYSQDGVLVSDADTHARKRSTRASLPLGKPPRAILEVEFGWRQRLQMAVAWAFPISLVVVAALAVLWRAALLPSLVLTWVLSLVIFMAFPLYAPWLGSRPADKRRLSLDRGRLQLVLWVLSAIGLVLYGRLAGTFSWPWLWRWALLMLALVVLVTVDLAGMTPVLKSATHEERLFRVALDRERCVGEGACTQVCPRECFELDRSSGKATIPGALRCVQCGACVVQCPTDALSFVGPKGQVVAPDSIRRHKLDLMGKRTRH